MLKSKQIPDMWTDFSASYLCKRFVAKPVFEVGSSETMTRDLWIQAWTSAVSIYSVAEDRVISRCELDKKPIKNSSPGETDRDLHRQILKMIQDSKSVYTSLQLEYQNQSFQLLHTLQDQVEATQCLDFLQAHLLILEQVENCNLLKGIREVDPHGYPSYPPSAPLRFLTFLIVTRKNKPHYIILLEHYEKYHQAEWSYLMNHFQNRVISHFTTGPPPRGPRENHFGWLLLPYWIEIRRYLSEVTVPTSSTTMDDLNFLSFQPQEWICLSWNRLDCLSRFRSWILHYVTTSLPYPTFLKGFLALYNKETNVNVKPLPNSLDTNKVLTPPPAWTPLQNFFPPVAPPPPSPPVTLVWHQWNQVPPTGPFYSSPSLLPYPFPSSNPIRPNKRNRDSKPISRPPPEKKKQAIPKKVNAVFEFMISQILITQYGSKPQNPNQDTVHDLINRVWRWLSEQKQTKENCGNRGAVAVVVVLTLKEMTTKKLLKQTPLTSSTKLYPHLFPIEFAPGSIPKFLYETLCSYAAFQLKPDSLTSDPLLTFYIQASLDHDYPSFVGQTSAELIATANQRALKENRQDVLHCNLQQQIIDLVEMNIFATDCKFSIDDSL